MATEELHDALVDTRQLPIITSHFERMAGPEWALHALAQPDSPQQLCQTFAGIIAQRRSSLFDSLNIHTVTNSTPSKAVKPPKRLQSDPTTSAGEQSASEADHELADDAASMATVGPVPDSSSRMSKKAAARTSKKAGSAWWKSGATAADSIWDGRKDAVTNLWCECCSLVLSLLYGARALKRLARACSGGWAACSSLCTLLGPCNSSVQRHAASGTQCMRHS